MLQNSNKCLYCSFTGFPWKLKVMRDFSRAHEEESVAIWLTLGPPQGLLSKPSSRALCFSERSKQKIRRFRIRKWVCDPCLKLGLQLKPVVQGWAWKNVRPSAKCSDESASFLIIGLDRSLPWEFTTTTLFQCRFDVWIYMFVWSGKPKAKK